VIDSLSPCQRTSESTISPDRFIPPVHQAPNPSHATKRVVPQFPACSFGFHLARCDSKTPAALASSLLLMLLFLRTPFHNHLTAPR